MNLLKLVHTHTSNYLRTTHPIYRKFLHMARVTRLRWHAAISRNVLSLPGHILCFFKHKPYLYYSNNSKKSVERSYSWMLRKIFFKIRTTQELLIRKWRTFDKNNIEYNVYDFSFKGNPSINFEETGWRRISLNWE